MLPLGVREEVVDRSERERGRLPSSEGSATLSLQPVSAPFPSMQDVTRVLASFLQASSLETREDLIEAHPLLLSPGVIASLDEARLKLQDTLKEAQSTCDFIDSLVASLDLPTCRAVGVQHIERQKLTNETALLELFVKDFEKLLMTCHPKEMMTSSSSELLIASSNTRYALPSAPTINTVGGHSQLPWHQVPQLVLHILSYLTAEEVLSTAEEVCKPWQVWLFCADVSRPFWLGCVQREFQRELRTLMDSEGDDLLGADWRTVAMLCLSGECHDDATLQQEDCGATA